MEKVKKDGRLKIGTENQKNSITYIPNTVEETTEFTRLLITEMRLRGRSTLQKSLAQMQEELLECLTAEKNMEELIGQISEAKTREEAMKRIMTFVPCIMHYKSRVGIKLLTMILIEGLSNYQGAKFPEVSEMRSEVEREATYISKVENIVSTQILGAFGSEAQWSMPVEKQSNYEDGRRKVGTINMDNYKVRNIVGNLDKLIDISIVDDERKLMIKKCVKHYQELMCIMRKKGKLHRGGACLFSGSRIGIFPAMGDTLRSAWCHQLHPYDWCRTHA